MPLSLGLLPFAGVTVCFFFVKLQPDNRYSSIHLLGCTLSPLNVKSRQPRIPPIASWMIHTYATSLKDRPAPC
jgi:hypothetical protein